MKTVMCPVKKSEINGTDCLIICDVTEGILKSSVLPEGIELDSEQIKKCKSCQYHADSE